MLLPVTTNVRIIVSKAVRHIQCFEVIRLVENKSDIVD
jgi:hypothetical protein